MKKILIWVVSIMALVTFVLILTNKVEKRYKKFELKQDSVQTLKINTIKEADSIQVMTLKELKSKDLYVKNCKFCHGETGEGDGIKARLNSEICPFDLTKETKSDQFVYYVILNGRDKMPKHKQKLDEDKINVLVIYIKKFRDY